jgi:hypothetical protein
MGDVANAFKLKVADTVAGGVQGMADKAKTFAGLEVPPTSFGKKAAPAKAKLKADTAVPGVVDPMQWWGALTQHFQTIAADAMKDAAKKTAIDTTKSMAAGLAKDAMKTATGMARGMASNAGKTVAGAGRAAMNTALRSAQAWPTPTPTSTSTSTSTTTPAAKKPAAKKVAVKKVAVKAAVKTARKTSR